MGIYDSRLYQSVQTSWQWTARETRFGVASRTTITTTYGKSASALVLNVSNGGCRIRSSLSLQPGQQLTLVVEPHGMVEAEVCWTTERDAGLKITARDPFYDDYRLSYPP